MESIREIVSFSHSGVDHMWYPFAAKLDHNFSVISTETYYQLHDLMGFLRSMFATNNHSPELVRERNIIHLFMQRHATAKLEEEMASVKGHMKELHNQLH